MCSLIVIAAVVCGTNTSAADAPFASPSASSTCRVMFRSCVRRSVVTAISRTRVSYCAVPSRPPTPRELDGYREEADRFVAEIDAEYYLHTAGLKHTLALKPIYERHAELTSL